MPSLPSPNPPPFAPAPPALEEQVEALTILNNYLQKQIAEQLSLDERASQAKNKLAARLAARKGGNGVALGTSETEERVASNELEELVNESTRLLEGGEYSNAFKVLSKAFKIVEKRYYSKKSPSPPSFGPDKPSIQTLKENYKLFEEWRSAEDERNEKEYRKRYEGDHSSSALEPSDAASEFIRCFVPVIASFRGLDEVKETLPREGVARRSTLDAIYSKITPPPPSFNVHFLNCSFASLTPFIDGFLEHFPLCFGMHATYIGFQGSAEETEEKKAMFKTRVVHNERGLLSGRKGFMTMYHGSFLDYCSCYLEESGAASPDGGVIGAVPNVSFLSGSLSSSTELLEDALKCFAMTAYTIVYSLKERRGAMEVDFNTLLAIGYGSEAGVDGVRLITELQESGLYCFYTVAGKGGSVEVDGIDVENLTKERGEGNIPKVIQDVLDGGGKAYYV